MTEPKDKQIPQWAVGLIMGLVGVLATASVGLAAYIFSGLAATVERTSVALSRIEQRIGILEIRADTQEKFCRRINCDEPKEN